MTDNDDNWFNRRIEPLQDDERRDVDAIKQQLEALHSQRTSAPAAREPERLIDTFWREHGHKQDQQGAWHVFYSGLNTQQKQQLWNEYHQIVSNADEASVKPQPTETPKEPASAMDFQLGSSEARQPEQNANSSDTKHSAQSPKKDERERLLAALKEKKQAGFKQHLKPLLSSLVVVMLFLGLNYNQLVIAQVKQYVSPGDSLQGPIILEPDANLQISDEPRIIIPKINVDVPVVYDVTSYNEDAIQRGLERGVVHYGQTAVPGQPGNNVIVGHSSNNFLNSGKYKFAFVLLDRLQIGDTFILHYEGTRYVYKVTKKEIIEPTDFSLIQPTAVPTTTLITCTPPGTSWNRLVVQAEQISPDPSERAPSNQSITPIDENTGQPEIVPGNAPSLWERISSGLFGD